jgi:hypothetical protein
MSETETQPTTIDIFPAADKLRRLREQKDSLDSVLDAVKKQIKDAERELAGAMADAECRNFTRDGQMFVLTTTSCWSAADGCKEALYATLREKGHSHLFKINAADLRTFIRSEVNATEDENGETHVPGWLAGLVKCHEIIGVSMRAAPKKSKK